MRRPVVLMLLLAVLAGTGPAVAQVRTIDPNEAIDGDLRQPAPDRRDADAAPPPPPRAERYTPATRNVSPAPSSARSSAPSGPPATGPSPSPAARIDDRAVASARAGADADASNGQTFHRGELLRAAEGTFGEGAAGLAGILERTLKEQGEPNAYISGREASGAIVFGLRYGKGTMFHKVEGQQPVFWTGPSLGFDLGGDANKVFVLVYNLYDSEDLFRRFPAAEGRLYFVGGFAATYLRRGNIVLIPIRLGLGWRQGVNIGYMKFSHKSRLVPF